MTFAGSGKEQVDGDKDRGDPSVRVSVVIPALNEERRLGRLLSDIQRQSRRPDEVIVVDAGSCDVTVCIAE